MVVCGQEFSEQLLERINALLVEQPQLSRRALSRQVCEWLEWHTRDGRLKQMSCRVALRKLERAGVLQLPPPRAAPPRAGRPDYARLLQGVSIAVNASLNELGCIEVLLVDSRHSRSGQVWRALMQRDHYLGAGPLCGAQLRYLVRSQHYGIVAALAFSASAWRVAARDRQIGWSEAARAANLHRVVANSRLLIVCGVKVPNLASHVLALCSKRLSRDWQARYGYEPLLLESFVERARFAGSCYRAANWHYVGHSAGRGRQDKRHCAGVPRKDIYLYPLHQQWRVKLCEEPPARRLGQPSARAEADWAQQELGRAQLGDARLQARLISLLRDFYAQPRAQIPQACGTRAKTKAAYRFFDHNSTSMEAILQAHCQATAERAAAHEVVLAVQDTTSLNYNAQPAIENLGPIGTHRDACFGLLVHDTMAFSVSGVPLGLIDVQCWARDASDFGKKHRRRDVPIEHKESYKWLKSVQAAAHLQARLPHTSVVSVGDREADVFELFDHTRRLAHAPKLLIRAAQNRALSQEQGKLWDYLQARPIAGYQQLQLPRRGNRAARTAKLAISYAAVELKPPQGSIRLKPLRLWAVLARELDAPPNTSALEWLLLTTCEVESFAAAIEKLAWYTQRWGIEVYHRTLKSGCQIETRQLGNADRIEACLAIDLVVAWRIMHLSKLGREHPDVPCTVYFRDAEWKALLTFINRNPNVPTEPPSLRAATRLVARLGGFLGRKCDGEPGVQTLWLGLQRLDDITAMYEVFTTVFARPPPAVSSGQTYG